MPDATLADRAEAARCAIVAAARGDGPAALDDRAAVILARLLALGPLGQAVASLPPLPQDAHAGAGGRMSQRGESNAAAVDHAIRCLARDCGLETPLRLETL